MQKKCPILTGQDVSVVILIQLGWTLCFMVMFWPSLCVKTFNRNGMSGNLFHIPVISILLTGRLLPADLEM